ncbi:GH10736 [Drosophila grimshawi]|uniref:GH10736 n=1 Tax=Drosophila grimshawi TaxID=7222 RepID=B4JBQ9_DROGR|nr:GH10736 [Drosophila grimshawi]
MWNTEDIRLLRGGLAQQIYRHFFQCNAWLLYGIARCCHFFKLRYNLQYKRLEQTQYHPIASKLIVIVKFLIFLRDSVNYFVLGLVLWIYFFRVEGSTGQNFLISIVIQGFIMYVMRRIIIFLHSQEDRQLIMHVVNEIFYITRTIESKFGMIYHCELSLLCVYNVKLLLVYIMMESMWHKPYFLWMNFFYWVLLEYCSLAYFIYQMILQNWYRNLAYFLQRFIEYHQSQRLISGRYHRRLLSLFKLHLRINNLHQCIKKNVAWLPSAIYLAIFTSIFNMTLLIECIVFAVDEIENKVSCIIGPELNVKVCSIGTVINRSAYSSDYCQLEGTTGRQTQPMPIRWMAWESVLLAKFSTKSDVWSFAVALWEILTFAREQPYEHMTDANVIENIGHIYQDDKMHELLPMPLNCPREIYDLMCECWQRNESSRPNFREIHLFLQRKNLGFKPNTQTLMY